MILLQLSDFKGGKYDIPDADSAYAAAAVQEAINNFEKGAIYELLGVTEGDKFITWLAASKLPANAHYSKILDAFANDDGNYCGRLIKSLGMKEYLKAYVFYEYNKTTLKTSQAGVTQAAAETSIIQSPRSTMRFAESKFNDSLDTVEAIQWYCQNNTAAFPAFNGQRITVKYCDIL